MFKIIAGCYEQMLLGYSVTRTKSGELKSDLQFTDHSHGGSIKSVACGGSFLASGSSDEAIFLFDLLENKEIGSLQGHEGTITDLKFPEDEFLISASEDGVINVWEAAKKWDKAKTLRGHKGPVSSFDVHPSGKLALSVSAKDGTLRTWNMISGRPVYVKNMKKFKPEFVKFSPDGCHYVIGSMNAMQVYELESAKCVAEIESEKSILAMEYLTNELFAVAGEGHEIAIFKTSDGKCVLKFEAHTSRVKALHRVVPTDNLTNPNADKCQVWLVSASSDGHVKVWYIRPKDLLNAEDKVDKAPDCVLDIDTRGRLTCVTTWQEQTAPTPSPPPKKKRKK